MCFFCSENNGNLISLYRAMKISQTIINFPGFFQFSVKYVAYGDLARLSLRRATLRGDYIFMPCSIPKFYILPPHYILCSCLHAGVQQRCIIGNLTSVVNNG